MLPTFDESGVAVRQTGGRDPHRRIQISDAPAGGPQSTGVAPSAPAAAPAPWTRAKGLQAVPPPQDAPPPPDTMLGGSGSQQQVSAGSGIGGPPPAAATAPMATAASTTVMSSSTPSAAAEEVPTAPAPAIEGEAGGVSSSILPPTLEEPEVVFGRRLQSGAEPEAALVPLPRLEERTKAASRQFASEQSELERDRKDYKKDF
eukprot:XP_008675874.1 leucine-rich repeat extensin-like protein 5 [Zea mays]